jgi:rod shape-determining protein MreD
MAETPATQVWVGRTIFAFVMIAIIFIQLLPLDTRPDSWAAPDLMLTVALAWTARRPDFAPVFLIAGLFLLADLLFQRPPGLWAGLMIIGTEIMRSRARSMRNVPLMLEWGTVAAGVVTITLVYRVALTVVMTPQPPLGLTLIQMVMTIAIYPLVVVIAHFIFGVSRPAPGQTDSLGHRL